jgi:hypothetical protein
MGEPYDPSIQPQITDQRGITWPSVPGYSNQAMRSSNGLRLKKSSPIVPVVGKRPPLHRKYRDCVNKFDFYHASYVGGADYRNAKDAQGLPVFAKHPAEDNEAAKTRLQLSICRNYTYPICQRFGSFIFSQTIIRDTNPAYLEWAEDVDGNGTNLCDFMEDASSDARYYGIYGVVFDTTKQADSQTQATAQAMGNRPILSTLHPSRILNWDEDRTQLLIQHDVGEFGEVWLWTKLTVQKFALDERGKISSAGAPEVHGYPIMPIVLMSGLDGYESLIRDVAEVQKRLFNLDGILIEEMMKQTFTSHFILGVDGSQLDAPGMSEAVSIAGRKYTCINKDKSTVEVVSTGSDIAQADSIRASIREDELEIYRTIGLQPPEMADKRPESGRALRIRQAETVAMTERIAANTESAEKRLVELYNFATGADVKPPIYPDSFQEDDLQVLLQDLLQINSNNFGPKLKAAKTVQYIRQGFPELDPKERIELENEASEHAEEADKQQDEAQAGPVQPGNPEKPGRNEPPGEKSIEQPTKGVLGMPVEKPRNKPV